MQQFREAYLQANGTLVGADTEWSKYRDANPILNKDGTPRKAQHWSDWYSSQMNRAIERRKALRGAPPSVRKGRSEEHTSELQSLMRISYAVFCLKKKNKTQHTTSK